MRKARIFKTASYVPEKILTNFSLEKMVETSDAWITERTGIKERRIVCERTKASDISFFASVDIVEEGIDLLIVSTSTPDMIFPSTASILAERLNLKNVACFDISAACTGALYALECGRFFIESGQYKKALITSAETTSKVIDWKDRNTCVLFGDGAGACLLKEGKDRGIIGSYFNTNGSLADILTLPLGETIKMEGKEVFKYAVLYMTEAIEKLLFKTGFKMDEISLIIPHQANLRIITLLAKRLKIPEEKMFINLYKYGNMVSASTIVALDEANKSKRIKEEDLVLLVGIGGGLTWGAMLVRW
ncbi:MAG: beta-ketoacyl-ACP synthase III [bacterium]